MKKRDLQRIQKMVRMVQNSLKLASYRIKSQIQDAEVSEYADIVYEHPKRAATIVFNTRQVSRELKNTIIHELLHLFISKHLGVAENVFERQKKHRSLKKYQKGEEKAINILAPLLEKAIFK